MEKHPVVFAGAGPGDPELITVKGQKALEEADLVVVAGSLVPEAVTRWCREGAERVDSAPLNLDETTALLVAGHRAGKKVVRLHSGDPSLYGAIFEQMERLDREGVPYSVIPGVTAAFAAAAALGIEYTLPGLSQTFIVTRMAGRTPVPETEELSTLAAHRASMAIYLSSALAEKVGPVLAKAYGADAPVVVAVKVSHPDQRLIRTTAGALAETMEKENVSRQALILAGPALAGRELGAGESRLYDKNFSHGYRRAEGEK
jgi:precorrin-4/cobalt-precorrin-4 C11-methyltransferase